MNAEKEILLDALKFHGHNYWASIEFPSQGFIRQRIHDKKLLRQSKDMLRENREKYDVQQREPVPSDPLQFPGGEGVSFPLPGRGRE